MRINVLQLIPGAAAAEGVAVIIDVFRAFTVEAYIMNNGAKRLFAAGEKELAYKAKKEDGGVILIGERKGVMLPGFDYGNSPSGIENADFSGKTVVHTTSAGTQGIANAVNADLILTGALVNARATAEYIKRLNPQTVSLVCMGLEAKRPTEEDDLCAFYIKALLEGKRPDLTSAVERLSRTSGAKFFDPAKSCVFPRKDFFLCTKPDVFGFALSAERAENGMHRIKKIEVY